ncbi:MAG: DUF3164 family protein [Porticoccaceae bacterium]|nr:DUF3164 family protein [Porticoccaceae bacterium]
MTLPANTTPPKNMMIDSAGQAVPRRYVKPYDRKRDQLARRCLARWLKGQEAIDRIYRETAADIETLEAMAAEHRSGGRQPGTRGNFQFSSFDGSIQVARAARYELRFDERLRVAQEIIEEMIAEKATGIDRDLAELLRGVFRPTSDGLLSQARVMGLFRLKIRHKRWQQAMDLIRESIESRRGKNLLSLRVRGSNGEWQSILLNIAAVADDGTAEDPA